MSLVPIDETYTEHGARVFAHAIRSYWLTQGYFGIRTQIVPVAGIPNHWTVASNIVNGRPPREAVQAA